MGKNKNWCTTCTKKHFPPTGKKCPVNIEKQKQEKAAVNVTVEESSDVRDSLLGHNVSKSLASAGCSTKGGTRKKDLFVAGPSAPGHDDLCASSSADLTDTEEEEGSSDIQARILQELQRMNSRLDVVEQQVGKKASRSSKDNGKKTEVKYCL